MYISKVDIAFKAVDGGDLLGDTTVFVRTAKKSRKAVAEAALAALEGRTANSVILSKAAAYDQVEHQRLVTSIETVDLRRHDEAAGVLEGWGLKPKDMDEVVHEAASALASDANNGGLKGQIEFLGKMDPAGMAEEIVNVLNCGN